MKKRLRKLGPIALFIGYLAICAIFPSLTPLGTFGVSPAPYRIDPATQTLQRLQHAISEANAHAVMNIWDSLSAMVQARQDKIREIHQRSEQNLAAGLSYVDSLIAHDPQFVPKRDVDLHRVLGEIYYDHDSVEKALFHFQQAEPTARNFGNLAACYAKMGAYEPSDSLLQKAIALNPNFHWHLANLHEMQNQPDKAIAHYEFLARQRTALYSACKRRIAELKHPDTPLFTEIQVGDQEWRFLFTISPKM